MIVLVAILRDQAYSTSYISLTQNTIDADDEVENNIYHGLSMPLIAISGVAVALVALISLLKTR